MTSGGGKLGSLVAMLPRYHVEVSEGRRGETAIRVAWPFPAATRRWMKHPSDLGGKIET